MRKPEQQPSDPLESGDRIDFLLEEISQRLTRGEAVDVESYAVRYPGYAERLRRAVPSMLAMIQLGRDAGQDAGPSPQEISPLGDYRIIRELGRGGMGIVYEAEQMSLGRRVAIKMLRLAALLDEQRLERFRNEARAAAMLDHPNIVSVLSVGCERGVHYYAMSLVDGQSLAEVVAKLRPESAAKPRRSGNNSLPSDAPHVTLDPDNDRRGFEWYHLWQACHDPALERTISQNLMVHSLDFLEETNSLVMGAWSRFIRVWNLDRAHDAPPELELRTDQAHTRCVKHLPGRNSLLTIDHDGVCREYSLKAKTCTWTRPLFDAGLSERVYFQAEVIEDQATLVVYGGSLDHGQIHLFDLATLEPLASKTDLPGRAHVGVTVSRQLLVGCDKSNRLVILDSTGLSPLGEYPLQTDGVRALRMSPDRASCALATTRRAGASMFSELLIWDMGKEQVQQRIGLEGEPCRALAYSPDVSF